MKPRRATISLLYNRVDATLQVADDLASFQYTDVASGSSDSVSLALNDRDRKWINAWYPQTGDVLQPTIQVENWEADGQALSLPCGTFHVDDFSFKGGPIQLSLDGLALPTDSSFKTTKRTETYEMTNLQEIGQAIADRAGMALYYKAPVISVERIEQSSQDDCSFYSSLVKKYGMAMKIYGDRLVVFSEADYEGKAAKLTLSEADFDQGWTFNTALTGTYTGVKYQYTNSDKNQTFTVTAGGGRRILTDNQAASNLTEASMVALAALNNANKAITTMKITMMARPGLVATDCIEITGLGRLSGKYYIEKISHSVGDGYKMTLDIRKVAARFTAVATATSSVAKKKSKQ